MKFALAVAPPGALPSAFVVWRDDLGTSIRKAADLGYDGVELALLSPDQLDLARLQADLRGADLAVAAISTGQVWAAGNLSLTHADPEVRRATIDRLKRLIEPAAELGALVNIGRVRGSVALPAGVIGQAPSPDRAAVEGRFGESLAELLDFAAPLGVTIVLEPINRYETDFINRLDEAAAWVPRLGRPNLGLMPDLFHMNLEETSITGALVAQADLLRYVHLADSNRLAPGAGHLPFRDILETLRGIGYAGWAALEILPLPDPATAARAGLAYLRPLLNLAGGAA